MASQPTADPGTDLGLPEYTNKAAGIEMRCSLVGAVVIRNLVVGMSEWYEPVAQFISNVDATITVSRELGFRGRGTDGSQPDDSRQGYDAPQNLPHLRFRSSFPLATLGGRQD